MRRISMLRDRPLPFVLLCAGGWLVMLGALGCQGSGNTQVVQQPGPPSTAVQHPLLEGIPLPAGFNLVPERSVARAAGPLRVAQCEFEGGMAPDAVARFYTEYMPTARFALRNKRFENGEYAMRFESEAEDCNIRIKYKNNRTILLIDIGPLSKDTGEHGEREAPARPHRS